MLKILNWWRKNKVDCLWIVFFLIICILVRLINFNNTPLSHWYDQGNYLYAGRLISQGYLPGKDFAVGHAPPYLYLLSFLWKLGFNLKSIHFFHLILSSTIIIPLFLIIKKIFLNKTLALLSCLFVIFSPRLFYYSRSIILDSIAIIFIAWSIYFYFCHKEKYKYLISGLLIGLAVSIKISFLLAPLCLILADFLYTKNKKKVLKIKLVSFLSGFFIIFGPLFFWLTLKADFLNDVVLFHLMNREQMNLAEKFLRVLIVHDFIFFLGLLIAPIIIFFNKESQELKKMAVWALVGILISLFVFKTFFEHHVLQFFPLLIIILTWLIFKIYKKIGPLPSIFIVILILCSTLSFFATEFTRQQETEKKIITILKQEEGYLYTATPYFALKAKREITPWHYMALSDAAFEKNVPEETLNNVFLQSQTILLDERAMAQLPPETIKFIHDNFKIIFQENNYTILKK